MNSKLFWIICNDIFENIYKLKNNNKPQPDTPLLRNMLACAAHQAAKNILGNHCDWLQGKD